MGIQDDADAALKEIDHRKSEAVRRKREAEDAKDSACRDARVELGALLVDAGPELIHFLESKSVKPVPVVGWGREWPFFGNPYLGNKIVFARKEGPRLYPLLGSMYQADDDGNNQRHHRYAISPEGQFFDLEHYSLELAPRSTTKLKESQGRPVNPHTWTLYRRWPHSRVGTHEGDPVILFPRSLSRRTQPWIPLLGGDYVRQLLEYRYDSHDPVVMLKKVLVDSAIGTVQRLRELGVLAQ